MRIVFSFASISRSLLSTPGSSTTATKSPLFWNMFIGGKLPIAAVPRPIQSLSIRASRARCSVNSASNGSLKVANIDSLHTHRIMVQFLSEPPLHEVALKISQLCVEELAIPPHIFLTRPAQMITRPGWLHRSATPRGYMPLDDVLRRSGSRAFDLAEARQPHGQPARRWWRIGLGIQPLQRRQDVLKAQSVRDAGNFAKGRLGFNDVHVRCPGR